MTRLLYVKSSILGPASVSGRVGDELVNSWRKQHASATVTLRDLGAKPPPHIVANHLNRPSSLADKLISELESADNLVIAAPMYNFGISSNLKAWLDHITVSGRTFRYTEAGMPEGLLTGKKTCVVMARGGAYQEGPAAGFDYQQPYLRTMLAFLGLTETTFIPVEGQRMGPERAAQGLDAGRAEVTKLLENHWR